VKAVNVALIAVMLVGAIGLAGCGHKLIAHGGDTTVPVYPSKDAFDKVKSLEKQGGPAGLIGGLGETMVAKKVYDKTPVKVLSSDDEGAQVEVLDGPNKGMQGYVANDNIN